jgi:release factor glutamine methyltransferase
MAEDDGVLLFVFRGSLFKIPEGVQLPKAGSLFSARSLTFRGGERVLELGAGAGVTAVLAARAGGHVIATDVVPECVEAIRANAVLNGVADRIDARLGDCYEPVSGMTFDLICTNPPQMPTPPGAERDDAVAAADNGGPDGWAMLDRVILGASDHLNAGGRVIFTIFDFLGQKRALRTIEEAGLAPQILARETQAFPRLGYERIDYLRSIDDEGMLPPIGMPRTVERLMLCGLKSQ